MCPPTSSQSVVGLSPDVPVLRGKNADTGRLLLRGGHDLTELLINLRLTQQLPVPTVHLQSEKLEHGMGCSEVKCWSHTL